MIRSRTKLVQVLSIITYTCVGIPFLVTLAEGKYKKGSYPILITMSYCCVVGILSFSIYRIRKYSQMLVQNNIFANEELMVAHLSAFAFMAFLIIACDWLKQFVEG